MKIKLTKATAHEGRAVGPGKVIDVSKAKGEELKKLGYGQEVSEAEDASLDDLTVDELKALAEEREIDLTGASKKADIIEAIEAG